jgi:hypothetical protein
MAIHELSLATWTHPWTWEDCNGFAIGLSSRMMPDEMPGEGNLVRLSSAMNVASSDVVANPSICETLILDYPEHVCHSAYFLGDCVLKLNVVWGYILLGRLEANPLKEHVRRMRALCEGGKLRMLSSFLRNRFSRKCEPHDKFVRYLKGLHSGRQRARAINSSPGSDSSMSSAGPASEEACAQHVECLGPATQWL